MIITYLIIPWLPISVADNSWVCNGHFECAESIGLASEEEQQLLERGLGFIRADAGQFGAEATLPPFDPAGGGQLRL